MKSNAIVLAPRRSNGGSGAGQMSRIDSLKLSWTKLNPAAAA